MVERTWREFLSIDSIHITNPDLDEIYIDLLIDNLETGLITQEDLVPIFVRFEPENGYFANDGNHRLSALKRIGAQRILADIYTLND